MKEVSSKHREYFDEVVSFDRRWKSTKRGNFKRVGAEKSPCS